MRQGELTAALQCRLEQWFSVEQDFLFLLSLHCTVDGVG